MKSVVRNTLIRHAFNTCDQGRLKQELHYIWTSLQDLHNISQPKPSISKDERPQFKTSTTLPYTKPCTCITRATNCSSSTFSFDCRAGYYKFFQL